MKKIFKWALFCCGDFEFSGLWDWCSKTNSQQADRKSSESSAPGGQVEVSLKSGNRSNHLSHDSEDGTYLAFQLEFKNAAKESIKCVRFRYHYMMRIITRSNCSQNLWPQWSLSNCSRVIKAQDTKTTDMSVFPVEGKIWSGSMNEKPIALIKIQTFKICGGFLKRRISKGFHYQQMNTSIKFTSVAKRKVSKDALFWELTEKRNAVISCEICGWFTRQLHDAQSLKKWDQFIDAYEKKMLSVRN